MPQRIVKQPNGLYAVWSTVVDDFVLVDATPEEIIAEWSDHDRKHLAGRVASIVADLDAGKKPYGQFTDSFEECLETIREIHGPDAESLQMLSPRPAACEGRQ